MKKSTRILSLILAVLMLVMAIPITAFAAPKETYVKDLRISTAPSSSSAAAKQWLIDNGYTVVDANLNEKSGKDYVYIGFTTTTNPDEAITDIALMQMDGGYSFSEYEKMVENMKREIEEIVDSLDTAIAEARANYSAGKKCAIGAREILNRFKEDDSGKLLGDLLFVEPIDKSIITKVFLQGNSDVTTLIYQMLAYACTDYESGESWLDKMADVNVYGIEDTLAESGLLPYYDNLANKMLSSFEPIQETLKYYEEVCKPFDESYSEEDLEQLELWEQVDYFPENYSETVVIYAALSNCKLGDGTLKDFFMKDYNELDVEDFYPLFVTMTDGQRAILPFVDYSFMITLAEHTDETAQEYEASCIETFDYYGLDIISVYTNVDRSLFEGGVALTSASLRKSASTGESPWYSNDNIDEELGRTLTIVAGSGLGLAVGAVAVRCATKAAMRHTVSVATASARSVAVKFDKLAVQLLMQSCEAQGVVVPATVNTSNFRSFAAGIQKILPDHSVIRNNISYIRSGEVAIQTAAENVMLTSRYKLMQRIVTTANVVMMVAMGISLIAEGIKLGIKVYKYYNDREYTDIPRIIVDEVLTSTDSYYVNYYAVKDQTGESGDLNAWNAKRWNALYTTTDKRAGDPIIASSFTVQVKNSVFPGDDHAAVHYFGETAAANVNRYQLKTTSPAIYVFYKRDHSLSMTASTFTGGEIVMYTGFGLIGGIAIGSLGAIGAGRMKKKKEEDQMADA